MEHKTLEIDNDYCEFGFGGMPLYHDCTMKDKVPLPYGWYGVKYEQCGGKAMWLVSFFNESANRIITNHVCDRHLAIMIKQAQDNNCAINDLR